MSMMERRTASVPLPEWGIRFRDANETTRSQNQIRKSSLTGKLRKQVEMIDGYMLSKLDQVVERSGYLQEYTQIARLIAWAKVCIERLVSSITDANPDNLKP